MYDNFKILNYSNSLVSPELFARHQSRLFSGNVIDGLNVVPKTGLTVTLQTGNAMIPYGSGATASARIMSLVADFDLTLDTADASNPRIDYIVIYVDMAVSLPGGTPTAANLDGPGVVKATFVKGTPNASPVVPTVGAIQTKIGAANPYFIVAEVRVDAGVTTLAATKFTSRAVRVATTNGLALGTPSYVDAGCVWTSTSGLVGAMSAGLVYINIAGVMVPVALSAIASRSFTASKDTYVSVNLAGTITYTEVANNTASPTQPSHSIWLAIVITNASSISSVNSGQSNAVAPVISSRILSVSDTNGQIIYPAPLQRQFGYSEKRGIWNNPGTSAAAINELTTAVLVPAGGRKVKVKAYYPQMYSSVDSSRANLYLLDGATLIGGGYNRTWTTGGGGNGPVIVECETTLAAGLHAISAQIGTGTGTGTMSVYADSTNPMWLSVDLV